jgi:hypothetical protein
MGGGEEKCLQVFDGETKGNGPFENLDVTTRIILKWTLENRICVNWINLNQDGEKIGVIL